MQRKTVTVLDATIPKPRMDLKTQTHNCKCSDASKGAFKHKVKRMCARTHTHIQPTDLVNVRAALPLRPGDTQHCGQRCVNISLSKGLQLSQPPTCNKEYKQIVFGHICHKKSQRKYFSNRNAVVYKEQNYLGFEESTQRVKYVNCSKLQFKGTKHS